MIRLYRNTAYMQTKVPFAIHVGTWCFCFGRPKGRMGIRIEFLTPRHWYRFSRPKARNTNDEVET